MSRDQDELARQAREARSAAVGHARRLPEVLRGAAISLARRHPWLTLSGALALGALGASGGGSRCSKRRRALEAVRSGLSSWTVGLGALAIRLLPDVLRAGAVRRDPRGGSAPDEVGRSRSSMSDPSA